MNRIAQRYKVQKKKKRLLEKKAKSLYDFLKQKKGEGSQAGEFNASKEWFDNFKTRSGFKKCKDNRKSNF